MSLIAAAAPILVILIMLLLRIPSLWAAGAGLVVAVLGAVFFFPLDLAGIEATARSMAPTVIEVALILLGGVTLAETMSRSGAQDRISGWLQQTESGADRTVTLYLLVYGLTPFMESVTGFGLGVVITAPLLIRLGLTPVKAVVAGLLGLVLVPWGSLGPGMLVAAQLGGQDLLALGVWTAVLTLPALLVSIVAVTALIIGRPTASQLGLAFVVVAVEWGTLIAANWIVGVPLSGVIASAAVILALLLIARLASGPLPALSRGLRRALVPYLVLVAGILATTAATTWTGTTNSLEWVSSPGLWLIIAALIGLSSLPEAMPEPWRIVRQCALRWVPIAGNAIGFLLVGIVMAATGMAGQLATAASQLGPVFVPLIPMIGALGGYLTGSNTGSAAMFSTATTTAATSLGGNPLITLAAQNVAGSFAIIASPARIALAVGVALPPGQRLPTRSTRILVMSVIAAAVFLGAILPLIS